MLDETFICVSVKVLVDCVSGVEYYVTDNLVYDGIPIVTGITMSAVINGSNVCVTYDRDDSNISSNSILTSINQIFGNCGNCLPAPTPTTTITPTITPTTTPTTTPTQTITPTPGASPSQTPTMTPTQTKTPTPTPSYVYVYESCSNISPNAYKTQIVQTIKSPITSTIGECFKDASGNCWTYNGQFDSSYIVPPTFIPITYTGDYFISALTITYVDCESCLFIPPTLTAYVSGGLGPCQGGTLNDTITYSASVYDSNNNPYPVSVDTTFFLGVSYNFSPGGCSNFNQSQGFSITIPAGQSEAIIDCTNGGVFVGNADDCGSCPSSSYAGNNIDNITVYIPAGC
jgi:hypothetical protein